MDVFRFNFRQPFAMLLGQFAGEHQHDPCDQFREAFAQWEITHAVVLREEQQHLASLGYVGDFRNKVLKSARYYFRKKEASPPPPTAPSRSVRLLRKPSHPRKKYSSIDEDLATKMTEYLEIESNRRLKPSQAFKTFCEKFRQEVLTEMNRLQSVPLSVQQNQEAPPLSPDLLQSMPPKTLHNQLALLKIKKTFKNKHFIIKKQQQSLREPCIENNLLANSLC